MDLIDCAGYASAGGVRMHCMDLVIDLPETDYGIRSDSTDYSCVWWHVVADFQ